jgi:hypothetical protein
MSEDDTNMEGHKQQIRGSVRSNHTTSQSNVARKENERPERKRENITPQKHRRHINTHEINTKALISWQIHLYFISAAKF